MRTSFLGILILIAAAISIPTVSADKPDWLKCDPSILKYKPTITLSGDIHDLPALPAAPEMDTKPYVKDMRRRISEASEGRYFLGLEGLYVHDPAQWKRRVKIENWKKAKIFGFEHPFPGGLTLLMKVFLEVRGNQVLAKAKKVDHSAAIERAKADFLVFMSDNGSLRDMWKKARSENPVIPLPKDEEIGKILDQVVANPTVNRRYSPS